MFWAIQKSHTSRSLLILGGESPDVGPRQGPLSISLSNSQCSP